MKNTDNISKHIVRRYITKGVKKKLRKSYYRLIQESIADGMTQEEIKQFKPEGSSIRDIIEGLLGEKL